MSTTDKPYSDAAYEAAREADRLGGTTRTLMDAAHDRETLGLDASVHAASYRAEVIEDVAAWLRSEAARCNGANDAVYLRYVSHSFLREFEVPHGQ